MCIWNGRAGLVIIKKNIFTFFVIDIEIKLFMIIIHPYLDNLSIEKEFKNDQLITSKLNKVLCPGPTAGSCVDHNSQTSNFVL